MKHVKKQLLLTNHNEWSSWKQNESSCPVVNIQVSKLGFSKRVFSTKQFSISRHKYEYISCFVNICHDIVHVTVNNKHFRRKFSYLLTLPCCYFVCSRVTKQMHKQRDHFKKYLPGFRPSNLSSPYLILSVS